MFNSKSEKSLPHIELSKSRTHRESDTGWWFFPGTPVSSTNITDRNDTAELLLKVALNTIKQTNKHQTNAYDIKFVYI